MGSRVSFTKQEIKQDKFADFISSAREFTSENATAVAGAVLALVLLIVGFVFYQGSQETSHAAAARALGQAKTNLAGGNVQVALLEFRDIADENRGSPLGGEALYILGSAHYLSENFAEAQRVFEEYVERYSSRTLTHASALAGIAACMENNGEYGPAARRFLQALDYSPDGPVAEDYAIGALRNYLLAGESESARKLYERIIVDFWQSTVISTADRLMNEFGAAG